MLHTMSHITPEKERLVNELNEDIRLLNCLVSQVGELSKKIENRERELNQLALKKDYIKVLLNSAIEDKQRYLNSLNKVREELNSLKWYQFKKKRKVKKEIEELREELVIMNNRIEDLKTLGVSADLKLAEYPRQITEVELPNLKSHIEKLKEATISYNKTKDVVEVTLGLDLPRVSLDLMINGYKNGLPQPNPMIKPLEYVTLRENLSQLQEENE